MTTFRSRNIRSNSCQLDRPSGCFHPDVGRVDSSESLQASVTRRVAKDFGISHVMIDERMNLFMALSGIQRFSAALHQVSNTVRFRAPTTLPKRMQREPSSVSTSREHRFRHHGKSTAHTGEAAVLGKAAQFNCARERTRDVEIECGISGSEMYASYAASKSKSASCSCA